MKTQCPLAETGSVLVTALMTITILTTICALSLYITGQDTNSKSQTASWQLALSAAESGVEHSYFALNKSQWTGWNTVTGSVPTTQPSGGSSSNGAPTSGKYNYYIRTITVPGEGGGSMKYWTTIDTAGLPLDHNGNQWYRVRCTGIAYAPGPQRASNSKKDNDLRRISIRKDRISNQNISAPQATRTIEVIAQAIASGTSGNAATLATWLDMSGGGVIDSFDSSSGLYSTNHLYDSTKRLSNGDVGVANNTAGKTDLRSTYVYGDLVYSGTAPKNTSNVQGNISSPFTGSISSVSNPTWAAGSYTNYANGSSVPVAVTSGTTSAPVLIKINGDFTVGGGQTFTINSANTNNSNNAIIIWVTGKLTTSGSGMISQDSHVNVTWYVDSDITVSGSSFANGSGYAANMTMYGVGNNKATISGSGAFVGVLNAPGYDVTISGSGGLSGSVTANTLTISGGASLHYDQALSGSSSIDHFSYASWFEDTADVARGATY